MDSNRFYDFKTYKTLYYLPTGDQRFRKSMEILCLQSRKRHSNLNKSRSLGPLYKSKDNPADLATRGRTVSDLAMNELLWERPAC